MKTRRSFWGSFPMAAASLSFVLAGTGVPQGRGQVAAPLPAPAPELRPYAAFGSAMGDRMRVADLQWSDAQLEAFVAGLRASFARRSFPFDAAAQQLSEQVGRRLETLAAARTDAAPPAEAIEQYLREAREGLGMQRTDSGLLYVIVQAGAGPRPRAQDRIVVSFTAVAADGKTALPQLAVQKLRTRVSDLLPGLAEGVQLIALGGRAAFVLPPQLSFGAGPWPAGVDAGTPLIFRVELEDILPASATP